MKKKNLLWVISIALVIVTGSTLFIINIISTKYPISISPNNKYRIVYNHSLKVIEISNKYESSVIQVLEKDPTFFWSSNSRFLAETFTKDSFKQSIVMDFTSGKGGITMPTPFEIQEACPESKTKIEQKQYHTTVYFEQWLDNTHGLVRFTWSSDVAGKQISGWLTCEFPSRTISDAHIAK